MMHIVDLILPVGTHGDCYDRYSTQPEEMRHNIRIMMECLNCVPGGVIESVDCRIHLQLLQQVARCHLSPPIAGSEYYYYYCSY